MRQLTITATEWASVTDGTLWLVRDASYDLRCPNCGGSASLPLEMTCSDHRPQMTAPAEFMRACASCWDGKPCPDCRIELVGPCLGRNQPDHVGFNCPRWCTWGCNGTGTVTLGYGYAISEPEQTDDGKWALQVQVVQ